MSLSEFDFPALRRTLLAWFRHHQRDLPWKRNAEPYHVWISEIMLQQTTVAAVIPYFERFLDAFPSVVDLARADQSDVLKLWEGLGYYSRARNLHKAANIIVESYQGVFPKSVDVLQTLPGIGRYTAGAIVSFAHDLPAPIVEANTLRLYSRLLGFAGDPRSREGQDRLWQFATDVLPRKHPGRINQALMDVGATICTPRDPTCDACPLVSFCDAFQTGRQESIPQAKPKIAVTQLHDIAVAILDRRRVLLRQRHEKERWAGLWDFPRWTVASPLPKRKKSNSLSELLQQEITAELRERTGLTVEGLTLRHQLKHSVTRYRIELSCLVARKVGGGLIRTEPLRWVRLDQLHEFPLSVTARTFARKLLVEMGDARDASD